MAAQQILWCLPFELQIQIINLLTVEEKMACMLVCRPWSVRMIDPAFWTSLQTGYQNLWPSTKWDKPKPNYSKALDYARGCVLDLELNVPAPICIRLLRRLVQPEMGQHLRTLSLDSPACSAHIGAYIFDKPWLNFCATTLETLRLRRWCRVCLPDELPKLKYLELDRARLQNENGLYCPLLVSYKDVFRVCQYCWDLVRTSLCLPEATTLDLELEVWNSVWAYDLGEERDKIWPDQHYAMECSSVENLTLHVRYGREYYSAFDRPDFDWRGQCLGIANFLKIHGSSLKSLTLQEVVCEVEDAVEVAFRLCPQLCELSINARQKVTASSILDVISQVADVEGGWIVDLLAVPWWWGGSRKPKYTYHVYKIGV